MFSTQAFTLLEILVTVALVAILTGLSIPSYDQYMIKTRIVNMLSEMQISKAKLIEDLMSGDIQAKEYATTTPKLISKLHVFMTDDEPQKYVIEVEAKMRTDEQKGIGLRQPAHAHKPLILQLQGEPNETGFSWACHVAAGYNEYVPLDCRNNELIEG